MACAQYHSFKAEPRRQVFHSRFQRVFGKAMVTGEPRAGKVHLCRFLNRHVALFAMSRCDTLCAFIWVSLNWQEHALLDCIGGLGKKSILKNPMITSSFGLSIARASQFAYFHASDGSGDDPPGRR